MSRLIRVHVEPEVLIPEVEAGVEEVTFWRAIQARWSNFAGLFKKRKEVSNGAAGEDLEMQLQKIAPLAKSDREGVEAGVSDWVDYTVVVADLEANSEHFRAMLASGLRESQSPDSPIEMTLSAEEAAVFPKLLRYASRRSIPSYDDKESFCSLLSLLILADQFIMPGCVEACVRELISNSPRHVQDVVTILEFPEPLKAHVFPWELINWVSTYTGLSRDEIIAVESRFALDEAQMIRVIDTFQRKGAGLFRSEGLFTLLLDWYRFGGEPRWQGFTVLFGRVNRDLMGYDFQRIIRNCPELICNRRGRALLSAHNIRPGPDFEGVVVPVMWLGYVVGSLACLGLPLGLSYGLAPHNKGLIEGMWCLTILGSPVLVILGGTIATVFIGLPLSFLAMFTCQFLLDSFRRCTSASMDCIGGGQ